MACSRPTLGCVPRSFRTHRSTPMTPQRNTVMCTATRACPHELDPAAQTGVQYRYRTASLSNGGTLKIIEDHRRHRTSVRQRVVLTAFFVNRIVPARCHLKIYVALP